MKTRPYDDGRFTDSGLHPVEEVFASNIRGHAFFPTDRVLVHIPRLYATEGVALDDKIVHLHYFIGGCDWYVMELHSDQREAFGYVNLNDPQNAELGYFDLIELMNTVVSPHGFPQAINRDLGWTPRPFGAVTR